MIASDAVLLYLTIIMVLCALMLWTGRTEQWREFWLAAILGYIAMLFILGDYRLPFKTVALGETRWRGVSRDLGQYPINWDIRVEGRLPALELSLATRPAMNDNEAV